MAKRQGPNVPSSGEGLIEALRVEIETGSDSSLDSGGLSVVLGARARSSELVLDAVEQLLDAASAELTRAEQIKLIEAARVELAKRRWPLARLLQAKRLEVGLEPDAIAVDVGIAEGDLLSVETGTVPIWKLKTSDPISTFVRWIRRLGIPSDLARRATMQSLPRAQSAYLVGAAEESASNEREAFIRTLLSAIDAQAG